jgi:hypothetical protein
MRYADARASKSNSNFYFVGQKQSYEISSQKWEYFTHHIITRTHFPQQHKNTYTNGVLFIQPIDLLAC